MLKILDFPPKVSFKQTKFIKPIVPILTLLALRGSGKIRDGKGVNRFANPLERVHKSLVTNNLRQRHLHDEL